MDHDQRDDQRDEGLTLTRQGSNFRAVPEILESDHEPVFCLLGVPRKI